MYLYVEDAILLLECALERLAECSFSSLGTIPAAFLQNILRVVHTSPPSSTANWLRRRIDDLISLRPLLPTSNVLDTLIATILRTSLPFGHDGLTQTHTFDSLMDLVGHAKLRWLNNLQLSCPVDLNTLIRQDIWTIGSSEVICGILYADPCSHGVYTSWLTHDNCALDAAAKILTPTLLVICDCTSRDNSIFEGKNSVLSACIAVVIDELFDLNITQETTSTCAPSVYLLLQSMTGRIDIISTLEDRLKQIPLHRLPWGVVNLAVTLSEKSAVQFDHFIGSVLDHALHWCTRCLSCSAIIKPIDRRLMEILRE